MAEEPRDTGGEFAGMTPPVPLPTRPGIRCWVWVPWSLVVILAASTTWFAVRNGSRSPAPPQPASAASPTLGQPGLEAWPDGKMAAELLGYTHAHAFRWSAGVLSGWVEFDDGPKPRRVPIDLNRSMAKKPGVDPSGFSGQIIIARRRAAEPATGEECWVWVQVERDVEPGVAGRKWRERRRDVYHGPWKARGDTEGSIWLAESLSLHSGPRGESFTENAATKWLELRVEANSKTE